MEETIVRESVSVGVVFNENVLMPKWFVWNGKRYRITAINYRWKNRIGKAEIYHIMASDGPNIYELSFNNTRLTWELLRIFSE